MKDFLTKVLPSFLGGMLVVWGIQEKKRFLRGDVVEVEKPPSLTVSETALQEIGEPTMNFVIHRSNYSVGYDPRHRNPAWVYERLSEEQLRGGETKAQFKLSEEQAVPYHLRAKLEDFRQGMWERAHLCPPADQRFSRQALSETFYLSNIAPQARKFNQGIWRKLEKQVRDWTKEYETLDVFTGPLYLPQEGEKETKISHLGTSKIAIPTHYYKVVLGHTPQGYELHAFLLPNKAISRQTPLEEYKTSLIEIEKAAGMVFFPHLEGRIDKKRILRSTPVCDKCGEEVVKAIDKLKNRGEGSCAGHGL